MQQKKLIVIGGGAAGFFCAVNAARLNPGLQVTLLEKSNKLLSKVKVSGGGRCNVTHACYDITEMSSCYPRGSNFVKKTFHQFFTNDTIEWFKERKVALKTEADGRMFPVTDSSQTIINCLLSEATKHHVQIKTGAEVKAVVSKDNTIEVKLSGESGVLTCHFLCIACGGFPKAEMFNWLNNLGLGFEKPVPSLFTFNMPRHPITELMGISVANTRVKISGTKLVQEGPLLITHWGLSGPVILKLSAWGAKDLAASNYKFEISVNWLPEYSEQQLHTEFQQFRLVLAANKVMNKNPFGLPQRLWEYFIKKSLVNREIRWADLPTKEQNKLIKEIFNSGFQVNGKTTFKEEFVTCGGIMLKEVDYNTMMSKKLPNIFFAGEILDVDGITGGFNFQHAWTSGFIAAKSIAQVSK